VALSGPCFLGEKSQEIFLPGGKINMAKLFSKGEDLYIDDGHGNHHKVLKGWESYSGWYWFATEKLRHQVSVIDGKEVMDIIWFGYVQGLEDEWGNFSQAEIESLWPKTWKIPKENLHYSGRRR